MFSRSRRPLVFLTIGCLLWAQWTAPLLAQPASRLSTTVSVPDVVGIPAQQAKQSLQQIGLEAKFLLGEAAADRQQRHHVYRQSPPAGSRAARGSGVQLTIYDEPEDVGETEVVDVDWLTAVQAIPFPDKMTQQIDPRSGQLIHSVSDLVLDAGTTSLEVHRFRRLEPGLPGVLGTGWCLNWEKRALRNQQVAVIEEGTGVTVFQPTPSDSKDRYRTGTGDELTFSGGKAVRTLSTGETELFDGLGRLVERVEMDGTRVRVLYDAQGRLQRVEGPFGSYVSFTLDSHGHVNRIESSTGATVRYFFGSHDAAAEHDSVTLHYGYDKLGQLAVLAHPYQGEVRLRYDRQGRIIQQQWGDDATEKYEYETNSTRHTDAAGCVTEIRWSDDGRRVGTIDPLGHRRVVELNESGQMTRMTGPTGASSTLQYDERGRMTRVDNPRAGTLEMTYEGDSGVPSEINEQGVRSRLTLAQGRLAGVSIDDDADAPMSIEYDENGLPVVMRRGTTIETRYDYDPLGRVSGMTNASGSMTRFQYDRLGNVVRETDALGNSRHMNYDPWGRLVRETDPLGGLTSYQYGETGLVHRITASNGGSTEYEYDARGRITKITDALGRSRTYEYSPRGRVTAQHEADGATTKYEYDGNGNLVAQTDAIGGVSRWSFDELGALTEMQDVAGLITRRVYNERGLLAELQYADGTWVRYDYDNRGQRIGEEDDRGVRIAYQWSPSGRLTKSQVENKPLRTYEYDAFGNLLEEKLGEQVVVNNRYDAQGRMTEAVSADGRVTRYSYDANDNVLAWQDNSGAKSVFEYDASDQPIMVRNSLGELTRYRYNSSGNQIEAVDPLGNISRSRYTLANEMIEFTAPNGDRASCEYGNSGLLASVTQPNGVTSRYEYDGLGNVLRSVDPARGETTSEYDQAGRLIRQTDAKGQVTEFSYDAAGNLATKKLADGTTVQYRYDRDRLIEVDDGQFPVHYEYDKWGNRTKIHFPAIGKTLVYHYDDRDRVTSFEDGTGRTIRYEYDLANRVTKIEFDDDKSIDLTYDTLQRTQGVAFPNGVTGTYQYDTEGRPSRLKWSSDTQTLASWRHEYDAGGFCTKTIDQDGKETAYRYDAAGQLLEERRDGDTTAYSYAPGGHRLRCIKGNAETTYEYNEAGQLVKAGDESFGYDANGNLIRHVGPDGDTTYKYDVDNQLVKVDLPSGSTVEYGYAPTGERIWRKDAEGKKYYLTDGLHVIAELDEHFAAVKKYVHGPGLDRPVVMSQKEQDLYLLSDAIGSVRSITDGAGLVVAGYEYDAFGGSTSQHGSVSMLFTFTARELDPATGLYYYRARWYDPAIGRFFSPDPRPGQLHQPVTLNPYAYANNCPTRYVDPLGASGVDPFSNWNFGYPEDELYEILETPDNKYVSPEAAAADKAMAKAELTRRGKALTRPPAPPPSATKPPSDIKPHKTPRPDTRVLPAEPKPASSGSGGSRKADTIVSPSPSERFPKGYKAGGGGGFSSFQPPKPSVGSRIKNGLSGLGRKARDFGKKLGLFGVVVGLGLAATNVANADPRDRGHVTSREGGAFLGGSAGAWLGGAGAAAIIPSLGLGPFGPVVVIGVGLAGSNYGAQLGSNVGGHLVPPGSAGPDASDFLNPNAGGNRPPPPGTVVTLPGIDPRDFKPPPPDPGGVGEQTTSYQVIYQCMICKRIHDGGTFSDPARASLAGQRFQAEGYRVSIVPRKVTQ